MKMGIIRLEFAARVYSSSSTKVSDPNAEQRYACGNGGCQVESRHDWAVMAASQRYGWVYQISHFGEQVQRSTHPKPLIHTFITSCLTHRSLPPSFESHYHVLPIYQET